MTRSSPKTCAGPQALKVILAASSRSLSFSSVLSSGSGTRRGMTPLLAKLLKRRSAIEPEIGHMKSDGRLARCPLKGRIGDAVFAVLRACGHNLGKILAHLWAFWCSRLYLTDAVILRERHRQCVAVAA